MESPGAGKAAEEPEDYDVREVVSEVMGGRAQLLDVRSGIEWNAGHIAMATFAPLPRVEAGMVPSNVDYHEKLFVYCHSGVRARAAQPFLEAKGFDVQPLSEGFSELQALGLPVAR